MTQRQPVVLGIDVGTTSAKTTAFDTDGRCHGDGEVHYPLHEPEPGWAVQVCDEVIAAVLTATRAAAAEAADAGRAIAGIGCSTALHGLVAIGADDRPITPVLTWADMRAAAQAQRLKAEHPALHGRTGTPLHPMSPLVKLVWFRECDRATFDAARRWVGLKELLLHRLTGAWLVDHSVASATGLLELAALDWDAEALSVAGLDRTQLAGLVPPGEILELAPAAAEELGLPGGLPVVAGGGDGPLANLGVGAVRPGVAACSIGTSAALRLTVERPVADPEGRTFCYALTRDRWTVGGAINNGGVVLQWAGDALAPDLGLHSQDALMTLADEVPPGSGGLVMAPYLLSERAPHWSPVPRGAYVGLTRHHGRGHLVRAAIEGVCQQLALVLASMRDSGQAVHELRATGGFARSHVWRQMLADVLGMEVGFPSGHEGSGFGAALLAMEALGLIESIDLGADIVRITEVVAPDPEAADVYARMLPIFAGLYEALGPTFTRLKEFAEAPEPGMP
jgi:gluconokinase